MSKQFANLSRRAWKRGDSLPAQRSLGGPNFLFTALSQNTHFFSLEREFWGYKLHFLGEVKWWNPDKYFSPLNVLLYRWNSSILVCWWQPMQDTLSWPFLADARFRSRLRNIITEYWASTEIPDVKQSVAFYEQLHVIQLGILRCENDRFGCSDNTFLERVSWSNNGESLVNFYNFHHFAIGCTLFLLSWHFRGSRQLPKFLNSQV